MNFDWVRRGSNMIATEPEAFASIVPDNQGNAIAWMLSNAFSFPERKRTRPYKYSDEEVNVEMRRVDWHMMPDIRAFQDQAEKDHVKQRKLGVA